MDFQFDIPVTKRPMNKRELSARFSGLAGGAILGLAAPHVFCLGLFLAGAIGAGTAAAHATTLSYLMGAGALGVTALVGSYGVARSQKACCTAFGEIPSERFKKAALMVIPGIGVAAIANTALGRGLSDPAFTAQSIQLAFMQGRDVFSVLVDLCISGSVSAPKP